MSSSVPLIPPAREREPHPVLFQRPQWDTYLNQKGSVAGWTTDPHQIWIPSEQVERSIPKSLPRPELQRLMAQYKPVMQPPQERMVPSLLYHVFYSGANLAYIQKAVAGQVHQISGFKIPLLAQSDLSVIMGNVFEEHAHHANEDSLPVPAIVDHVRREVHRLNAIVIQICVPTVIANMENMTKTSQRILGTTPVVLPTPENTSIRGEMIYRPVERVLTG